MNPNLAHAARVIQTLLVHDEPHRATVIARALDTARLLADPYRSYGLVLHRTSDGRWSLAPQGLTPLERQALAWDAACRRAQGVASGFEHEIGGHPGVRRIEADGDRVRVTLHVGDATEWDQWRAYFGVTLVGDRADPGTLVAEGKRAGVRVSLLVRVVPPPPDPVPAARPYQHEGETYDLARPLRDAHGDLWYFQGHRARDGMPMLSPDGRLEQCSLGNVVALVGPLTAVAETEPPSDGENDEPEVSEVPVAVPAPASPVALVPPVPSVASVPSVPSVATVPSVPSVSPEPAVPEFVTPTAVPVSLVPSLSVAGPVDGAPPADPAPPAPSPVALVPVARPGGER